MFLMRLPHPDWMRVSQNKGAPSMKLVHQTYTNATNSIRIVHRTESGHFNMKGCHSHRRYELYYLVSGERYFFIKDRTYLITQGDLAFINVLDLHKTNDAGMPDQETIIIEFDHGFISNQAGIAISALEFLFGHHPIVKLPLNKQHYVENLLRVILQEIKLQQLDFELYIQSLLQQLLIFTARAVIQAKPAKPAHVNLTHAKIITIVHYMNKNFRKGVSLESLGNAFDINPNYLSRTFKKVTGFTFVEYLNSLRIKEAQRLLRETQIKVATIADQVGFDNQSHFGRVFRSISGIPPLQYRKDNQP
jgi:AraC-like DNA-binding protein/mannose-6-phosphate isomerase-like protein (cupin superfamily)